MIIVGRQDSIELTEPSTEKCVDCGVPFPVPWSKGTHVVWMSPTCNACGAIRDARNKANEEKRKEEWVEDMMVRIEAIGLRPVLAELYDTQEP